MQKIKWIVGISFCLFLAGCAKGEVPVTDTTEQEMVSIENTGEESVEENGSSEPDEVKSLYMEFLNGNCEADGLVIADITTPTGEPDKQYYTEYTFFDSDKDGLDELHVRSSREYYIIDCESTTLSVWKTMYSTTEVLNNGDYLYTHIGGAPLHYDYEYFATDQEGEDIFSVSFNWYDANLNGEVDKEDVFLKEDEEISYEEWEEIEEKYLEVGTDEISWIVLNKTESGTTVETEDTVPLEKLDIATNYDNRQNSIVFCHGDTIFVGNIGYRYEDGKYYPNEEKLTDYMREADRERLADLLENNVVGEVLHNNDMIVYTIPQGSDKYLVVMVDFSTGEVKASRILPTYIECIYEEKLYYMPARKTEEGEICYTIEYLDCNDFTNHVVYTAEQPLGQMMVREDGAIAFATYEDGYYIIDADGNIRQLHGAIEGKYIYAKEIFQYFDGTGLCFCIEYDNHAMELLKLSEDSTLYRIRTNLAYNEIAVDEGMLVYEGNKATLYPHQYETLEIDRLSFREEVVWDSPLAEYDIIDASYLEEGYKVIHYYYQNNTVWWIWQNTDGTIIVTKTVIDVAEDYSTVANPEPTVWPYDVEEKVYEVNDTGISIEIFYPALHGFADAEKEEQINLLIENDIKRIIPDEVNEEPREDRIVCAYMDYEIKFMNENMISILYKGMNGCMALAQGLNAATMATTIDLETMEVMTLSDAVADLDELQALLLADTFENISLWEGEPGIDTISGEYIGKYQDRLLDALKDNTGGYHYIEWYIDGKNLIIVSLLGGLDDYNEYAASIESVEEILAEEFCEKLTGTDPEKDSVQKEENALVHTRQDLETVTELTKEEALDAVFAYFYGTTEGMVDFTSYETEDGRIGYTWYREHNLYDPVLLEQEGTIVNSKGETYQCFILCCKLCGTEGIHYRTEIFQEFAVNMCTGQIIEVREYDYMGFWEYSRDYRTYILEEKKTEGDLAKRTVEFLTDKRSVMKGDYRFEEYKFDFLSTYGYSDCLSRYAADYVYPDIFHTPDEYAAYLDMWKAEYEEAMKILGSEADEKLARKLSDYNACFEELQLAVTDFIENTNSENQKYAELYLALMVRDATLDLYSWWYASTGEIAFDMVEECTEVVIPSMYFDASIGEDNALDRDFARFEFDGTTLKGEEMLYKMYSGWLEEVEDLGEAASPETGYADYIFRCQTALEYYFEAREELGYDVWFVDEFTQFGYSTYKFMAVRDYALMLEDIYNRAMAPDL